jgi:hypothetical protein
MEHTLTRGEISGMKICDDIQCMEIFFLGGGLGIFISFRADPFILVSLTQIGGDNHLPIVGLQLEFVADSALFQPCTVGMCPWFTQIL